MSQTGASFVGTVISSTVGSVERTSAKDLRSRHTDVHMNFLSRVLPSSFLLVLMSPKNTAEAPK